MNEKTDELRDIFTSVTGQEEVTEEQEDSIDRESYEGDDGLPVTTIECPECENDEAKWYLQQTRAADESETRFYICTECNHKWRDYD